MFYLMMHSTCYLWLYDIRHMVKNHSAREEIYCHHMDYSFQLSVVRVIAHGAMGCQIDPSWGDPLSYFLFQPVLHDWCNKGRGMCYPVCGMVHVKEPLLLIGSSGFPLSLSEWSDAI